MKTKPNHSWADGQGSPKAHICNCIGCCEKCGGCRTDPRHAKVCDEVTRLKEQIADAYRRAEQPEYRNCPRCGASQQGANIRATELGCIFCLD